jgi:C1A family cysteine protease
MGALESALAIHQGIKINLSEQEALDCRRGDSWGCNGALMTSTDYLLGGVTTERNYPYVGWQTRCKRFEKAAYATEIKYLGSRNRRPSIDEIKAALIKYGPLVVDVYAGGSGWSGRTDKVTSCRRVRSTNHAVLLTGFSERGFEFKNSWGNWADNGYSFIGYNCDGFATEAIAVLVEGSPE